MRCEHAVVAQHVESWRRDESHESRHEIARLEHHGARAVAPWPLEPSFATSSAAGSWPRATVVSFSCKHRGFCPSCGGRRMAEMAAQLTDHFADLRRRAKQRHGIVGGKPVA